MYLLLSAVKQYQVASSNSTLNISIPEDDTSWLHSALVPPPSANKDTAEKSLWPHELYHPATGRWWVKKTNVRPSPKWAHWTISQIYQLRHLQTNASYPFGIFPSKRKGSRDIVNDLSNLLYALKTSRVHLLAKVDDIGRAALLSNRTSTSSRSRQSIHSDIMQRFQRWKICL